MSATIIPSLALPMSIVGTFAVMYLLDYSLDNLSLMALTLAVGFVVDDAIVVLENIVRHMEEGEKPYEAAVKGAQEIGFTIVSMTISLVAAFIPVLFMSGMLGRILREFAVTICVAILVSGFISLSLTPMLVQPLPAPAARPEARTGCIMFLGRCLDAMNRGYEVTLAWVMRHHVTTMVASLVVLWATFHMFGLVPKGLYSERRYRPVADQHRRRARGFLRADGAVTSSSWPPSSPKIPTSSLFSRASASAASV